MYPHMQVPQALVWLHVVHSNVGVLPLPQSLFSATRMSVFHMYVSSHHSAAQGRGGGGCTHSPFCVHVSLKTEHLRPGVRAKELHGFCFLVIT